MLYVPIGAKSFRKLQANVTGRPVAAMGTAVTPVVGSKGSWAQVFASLDYDTFGLMICVNTNSGTAASRNTVIDIGVGAAASEVVIIPDLIAGNAGSYTAGGLWYYFPIYIPAGTRVAVRAQGTVVTALNVFVEAVQWPQNPSMAKTASFVQAIGMTVPNGTAVTAGTTAEGAWTLMGTTAKDLWWWQIGFQVQSADVSHVAAALHVDLAWGDGTNFVSIIDSDVWIVNASEYASHGLAIISCHCAVPAGSSIYIRVQTSGTADSIYCAAYGAGG